MKPICSSPAAGIVPFAVIHCRKLITGDAVSAVFLALIVFVTVAAWFAGSSTTRSHAAKRS